MTNAIKSWLRDASLFVVFALAFYAANRFTATSPTLSAPAPNIPWSECPSWATIVPGPGLQATCDWALPGDHTTNVYVYGPVGDIVTQEWSDNSGVHTLTQVIGSDGFTTFVQGGGSSFDPNSTDPAHRVGPLTFYIGNSAKVKGIGLILKQHMAIKIVFYDGPPIPTVTPTLTPGPTPTPGPTSSICPLDIPTVVQAGTKITITLQCK